MPQLGLLFCPWDWIPVQGGAGPSSTPPLPRRLGTSSLGQRRADQQSAEPFLSTSVLVHGSPLRPGLPHHAQTASPGSVRGQVPGLRGAGHCAPAARLLGLPGPGHRRVLDAGEPRGASLQREIPARQVGAAAELHVSGRASAGLDDPGQGRAGPARAQRGDQGRERGVAGRG